MYSRILYKEEISDEKRSRRSAFLAGFAGELKG